MSDTYQAIYDAAKEIIGYEAACLMAEYSRPSAVFRPTLRKDGNQWSMFYGDNIQEGITGFGDTPEKAAMAFDAAWKSEHAVLEGYYETLQAMAEHRSALNVEIESLNKQINIMKADFDTCAQHNIELQKQLTHESDAYELADKMCDELLSETFDLTEQLRTLLFRLEQAEANAAHWKANHDNQVAKTRLLTQREDLPVDRLPAYAEMQRLQKRIAELEAGLLEARRAIGDHYTPDHCYATGPITGNYFRDFVECPACSFIKHYEVLFEAQLKESNNG